MNFLVLDLETTGLSAEKGDTIIDIGAIICDEHGIQKTFQTLVHPGNVTVSDFVHKLTGITAEMLVDAPSLEVALAQLREFLGENTYPIIGHNIGFDAGFLNHFGFDFKESDYVDTNDFSTLLFPEISSHSLEVLAHAFHIEHTEKHRALGDVHACYELLRYLKKKMNSFDVSVHNDIQNCLEKSTWGGRYFFSMTLPLPDGNSEEEHPVESPDLPFAEKEASLLQRALSKHLCSAEKTFFALPPFLPYPKMLLEGCEDRSLTNCIVLGSIQDTEVFKDHFKKNVLFLDKYANLFSREKFRKQRQSVAMKDDEVMLYLRDILGQFTDSFCPSNTLTLTHKERTIISRYAIHEDDYVEYSSELDAYFAKFTVIISPYQHFFFGPFHTCLQKRSNRIILNSMCMEPQIVDVFRRSFSFDSVRYFMQKISTASSANMCVAYQEMCTTLFEKISKKLKTANLMQQECSSFADEMADFQVFTDRFTQAMESEISTDKEKMMHLTQFKNTLNECIQGDTERFQYVKSYNNQITIFSEPRSISTVKDLLIHEANLSFVDSTFNEDFSYFIPADEYYALEENEVMDIIKTALHFESPKDTDSLKFLEKDDCTYFPLHTDLEKKSVVLCNTGAKLEKLFESYLAEASGKNCAVIAFGKSGGSNKVVHQFSEAQSAVLLTKFQEFAFMSKKSEIDALLLHSLPFPNVQGMYYDDKYSNTFAAFTIPITKKQLLESLCTFSAMSQGKKKTVYFFDSRMFTKEYGKEIVKPYVE